MSDHLGVESAAEIKHWRFCNVCGKRFSEQYIIWIDGIPFCGECQKKITELVVLN